MPAAPLTDANLDDQQHVRAIVANFLVANLPEKNFRVPTPRRWKTASLPARLPNSMMVKATVTKSFVPIDVPLKALHVSVQGVARHPSKPHDIIGDITFGVHINTSEHFLAVPDYALPTRPGVLQICIRPSQVRHLAEVKPKWVSSGLDPLTAGLYSEAMAGKLRRWLVEPQWRTDD